MILEVRNVNYHYKANKDKKILNNISYCFEEENVYAILGPSGSGKTTFLSLLAGLDVPVSGKILYKGEDIQKKGLNRHRKENVSLVFQNYNLIDYLTPKENVMLGGKENPEELLTAVGIPSGDWNRKVLQLSGGQQQRVAIARALVAKPAIVLADEPTGNLDSKTSADVMGLIKRTSYEFHQTVVMITHNNEIARLADRIVRIEDGKIVE